MCHDADGSFFIVEVQSNPEEFWFKRCVSYASRVYDRQNRRGGGWDDTVAMKYSGDGIWTNVQNFAVNDQFKIKIKGSWNSSWGADNVYPGSGFVSNSDGNEKVKAAGTYIVGFYKDGNKITLVKK